MVRVKINRTKCHFDCRTHAGVGRAGQIVTTTAAADHGSLLGQCACTLWAGGRSDRRRHPSARPPGTPHAHAPRYWIKTSFYRRRDKLPGGGVALHEQRQPSISRPHCTSDPESQVFFTQPVCGVGQQLRHRVVSAEWGCLFAGRRYHPSQSRRLSCSTRSR